MKIHRIIVTQEFQKDTMRWHQTTLDQCHSLVSTDWEVRVMNEDEDLYTVMVEHIPPQRKESSVVFNQYWKNAHKPRVASTITNIIILCTGDIQHVGETVKKYRAAHYPGLFSDNGKIQIEEDNFAWNTRLPIPMTLRHNVPST